MISEIFEKQIKVTSDHIDDLNHVNNVVFLRWAQDIAGAHWNSKSNPLFDTNYYWVILDHFIEYKGQAFLDDLLTIRTFVKKNDGIKSLRVVQFFKNNKLIVSTHTHWCLINRSKNKPCRIPKEVDNMFFGN